MRKFMVAVFVMLSFTVFKGCSKNNDSKNYLRGVINGTSFECTTNFRATKGAAGNKTIFFTGNTPVYAFNFFIDGQGNDITPGTYDFLPGVLRNVTLYEGNDGYSAGFFSGLGASSFYGSGKIVVQEINKKYIKGTFEFVTTDNPRTGLFKTVTNGEYYITRD